MLLFLRSLAFNVAFYINMIVWMIVLLPAMLLPKRILHAGIQVWSRLNLVLLEAIAGTRVEIRGLENLPAGGVLVASKHQSTFETLALLHLFHDPVFILKKELAWIPVFGWFCAKVGMIPVDRAGGREALRAMTKRSVEALQAGRSVLIYPEGTRRPPGVEPAYKVGVAFLYRATKAPLVPVALNSGLFWPRRGFFRYPGRLVVQFLPPIEPGLSAEAVMARLQSVIETASDALAIEALESPNPPPAPPSAARYLADRRKPVTPA
ncbi:lysophospholipid acyltransferase family protein [Prosthecomicrobium hirschii]|uniref:lysophospholipid acyltransferase family protein n=1 Tax=Prosthecodimorpha hirschii TaxID=665126 RepID=UPI000A431F16|nr:lysophospholipid acyltransferase family protein [Prosthecomicrobium hirschii]MCW1843041.1 1-acyl-sn-glycerol-3-phosphate acyltransferase [Prosthecomicrobium hirschii]